MEVTGYPVAEAPSCVDLESRVETLRIQEGRCERVTLRTFSASKSTCGAWAASHTQAIVELDRAAPRVWLKEEIHVTCEEGEDTHPGNEAVGYPYAVDKCQGELSSDSMSWNDTLVKIHGSAPHCLHVIHREWTVTDGCANVARANQTLYATVHC